MFQEVDYEPLCEDEQEKRIMPLATIAEPTSNSVLLNSVTSTVITSNSSGAITTGSAVENAKAEDSPQNAHRADGVATRAAQDQTQQLHDSHLKAQTTRERIAATAIGTHQNEEEEKDEGGGERSRIQQEREHQHP